LAFLNVSKPAIVLPMSELRETNKLGSAIGFEATSNRLNVSCAGRNGGRNRRISPTEKGKRGKTRRDPNRPLQTADVSTKPAAAPTAQGGPRDEPPNLKSAVAGGESQRSSRTLRRPVPQFYTVDEIAERLNLSRRSVCRLIQMRKVAAHRFGRSLRVSDDDLAEFLARNRSK
jgi:excisionase family DNA binding protein